jgi:Holliday junction DNA helicase RuvA
MYAYIKGEIADITQDNLVLECNNIGYNIRIPYSVAQKLPGIGETVKIYTYTSVREDAFNLFGFLSKDDLEVYKLLIAVNGIGPKGALSILSAMSADDLRFAIISGDAKAISKAQGVGSKSAERIILELKDKIKMFDSYGDENSDAFAGALSGDDTKNEARNEAIEALSALGYSPTDALKAVKRIEITEDMDSGAILKAALKVISTL